MENLEAINEHTISDPARDLRNVAVHGRSSTFVLLHLRTLARDEFDEWHAPYKTEMESDDLMRYFNQLRTTFLHDGWPAPGEIPTTIIVTGRAKGDGFKVLPIINLPPQPPRWPTMHIGKPIVDNSVKNLCRLYLDYLEQLHASAAEFMDRLEQRLDSA